MGCNARSVREGIVAHSTVRIAAGAGVIAASLLIVGPNPADAAADRHGSGQYNNDYRKNGSGAQGGYAKRSASNTAHARSETEFVRDVVSGISGIAGIDDNSKPDLAPPKMDLGTSSPTENLLAVQSLAPESQTAARSAAIAEAPVGDNVSAAALPGAGSGYSGQPAGLFRAPTVTFGNGRTPGTKSAEARSGRKAVLMQDALRAPDAAPSIPAVPMAIEINIPPLPPPLPPVERIRSADLLVGEFGTGTIVTVTDPLAGAAGLILIPAIGAVLGYRQARAAQSLRDSLRT